MSRRADGRAIASPSRRRSAGRSRLHASAALADVTRTDLLIVPGGGGWKALAEDHEVLDWIGVVHATTHYTASVCTGSLVLGAAGLLQGASATTHWGRLEQLRDYGAIPSEQRVVIEGKIATGAGVSAGIDMALSLLARMRGDNLARAVQLGIEYDPQPPFDCGSPKKAGSDLAGAVRSMLVW